jgi:hypothetical protein
MFGAREGLCAMTAGIEGVGEAVTGGMIAHAVESGTGAPGEVGAVCLNCGTALIGGYCHVCGQSGRVHRTLTAFWHDLAHSVLHFDGKIWRTLPLLAWRPGELTRRYVEGERARFVSPVALFLFSVFLMFALFSLLGGPFTSGGAPASRAEAARDLRQEQAGMRDRLAALQAQREQLRRAGRRTSAIELDIANMERQLGVMDATARVIASGAPEEVEAALADEGTRMNGKETLDVNTGWRALDRAVEKASKNPSLLLYKVQTNAYKFSWALIPISVPFLWLLFLHRRRYRAYRLYDHIVFVTYSIAFMSLGLIALSLLRPLGVGQAVIGLAITLVPPIHMYRQLRGAYLLSRPSAIWRTAVLIVFAMIAAALFLMLLLAIGTLA